MTKLSIDQLEKKYGNNTILSFNHWEVGPGLHWVKGGNGTGKTTLFKVIAGVTPFQGNIDIDGVALKEDPIQYRSLISYAEAEPQYPRFITGNDLLNYYREIRKASQQQIKDLAEQFEMSGFLNDKTENYSSGMLKKLSLICAFTGNSTVYLLDEPLITIDAAATSVLYNILNNLREHGSIILFSSHQDLDRRQITPDKVFSITDKSPVEC